MRSTDRPLALYDRMLASIGDRSADIEPRPLVSHWPHVGSAYRGLVIVGQALRGWPDSWQAWQARSAEGRRQILSTTRARNADRSDPLEWVPSNAKVRNSPFWAFSRHVVESLESDATTPWFARYAWVNLYPVAPESPPDNPSGPLKAAQEPFVGELLSAVVDWLEADRVVVVAGPQFWKPAAAGAGLAGLAAVEPPLVAAGRLRERDWLIGYHPKWASFQHYGATRYASLVTATMQTLARGG